MNYFELYEIPVSFWSNPSELRQRYLVNSRKWHPDFHTDATETQQEEMLRLSTLNNQAYSTLSDPYIRMKYVLELQGVYNANDASESVVPNAFLMDIMDINEQLMELEMEPNNLQALQTIQSEVDALENQLQEQAQPHLQNYVGLPEQAEMLGAVKDFFLKKQYLLRIRKKLRTFAPANEG